MSKTKLKISINDFGKDHWSLLAYVECRCVDYKGILDTAHLRIRNNAIGQSYTTRAWKPEYGTRLSGYFLDGDKKNKKRQLVDHDDLDCLDDFEDTGLVQNTGTGLNPACTLTDFGHEICAVLRKHKASGGVFATFKWEPKA